MCPSSRPAPSPRPALAALLPLMLSLSHAVAAAPTHSHGSTAGHQHGLAQMDIALEQKQLTVSVQAPLESLLGFEHAPRNDRERQRADALLKRLRQPEGLFVTDAAANCRLSAAEVQSPTLEKKEKGAQAAVDGHADLEARYTFQCEQPAQLRQLQVEWFNAFPQLRRVDVQVVGPLGQHKQVLRGLSRTVKLQR